MTESSNANPVSENPYADIFFDYIHSSLEDALTEIKATEHALPDDERVQAWHVLDYGLQHANAWTITRELLFELAPKMEQAGFRDDWIGYLERAIEQGRDRQDFQVEAIMCLNLGYLYQLQANYEQAQKWLLLSQSRFEQIDDTQGIGTVLNRLAYIARRQQKYTEAKRLCDQAIKALNIDNVELCHSYNILAELASDKGEWQHAERNLRKSLNISTQVADDRHTGWGYLNLGLVLQRQEKFEEAKKIYLDAAALFDKIRDPLSRAIVQMNTGIVLSLEEKSEDALSLYLEAKKTFLLLDTKRYLAMIFINIGIELRKVGNLQEAEEYCLHSITLWKELKNTRSQCNAMDELGLVYLALNESEKARTVFQNALDKLHPLSQNPGYERLATIISEHLTPILDSKLRATTPA